MKEPKRSSFQGIRPEAIAVFKGLTAIFTWLGCYVFVHWFESVGWIGYLVIALPVAFGFTLVASVSTRARRFLSQHVPDAVERILQNYENSMGWVVVALLVAFY